MRIKKIVVVVIALLLVALLFGKSEKNFLWEIEKGNTKVYLLGSVHFMKPEIYPLNSVIEDAFEESDVIVVEVDATKLDANKIQQIVAKEGMFTDERTLQSVLPEDCYKKLSDELSQSGMMTIEMVNKFKPWYVMINLASIRIMKMGMNPELGIDLHFLNAAKDIKEIIEFETPESQFELLCSLDDTLQIENLKDTIEKADEFEETINQIIEAWQKGDAKAMDKLINKKIKDVPELKPFYDKMFTERNIKMADKIAEYLQKQDGKTYFVIVGSGHYVGKEGILKLLKKKGYKAKQM